MFNRSGEVIGITARSDGDKFKNLGSASLLQIRDFLSPESLGNNSRDAREPIPVGLFRDGDTFPDRESTRRIRELERRIDELEKKLTNLARIPGPPGPPGTSGEDGEPGEPGMIRVQVFREGRLDREVPGVRNGSTIRVKISKQGKR